MKYTFTIGMISTLILLLAACNPQENKTAKSNSTMIQTHIKPPMAKKVPKKLVIHGDTRIDNYYWLNQRSDKEVINYLEQENEYTKTSLAHTEDFQENLFKEIVGRIKQDDESVPYLKNGYYYYRRYEEGKEYPIYARKKGDLKASEEILIDQNLLAKDYAFHAIGDIKVSTNNQILAFSEDTLSRRIYNIRFIDLQTGEFLQDIIKNTGSEITWANDNKTIYYTRKDETLRSFKVFRHLLGVPSTNDPMIYHETDATFDTSVHKTKSNKYIVIGSESTLSTELRLLDLTDPKATFQIFNEREKKHEYDIDHYDGKFYVRTNWNAQNFKLMVTQENQTSKEHWKEMIPHRADVLLEEVEVFKDYLVLEERIDGIGHIRIKSNKGGEHYIDFGEKAYVAYASTNYESDTDELRLVFTSLTTPVSTFDYNMKSRKFNLLKQQEVVGDFSKTEYQSERLFAEAKDGTRIPISIVYKKGFKKDGSMPVLLYAYGSYGHSTEPYFSSIRLSLLDRGFAFAMAHVRGGEEMGRQWYEDGKLLKKKNTFTDFITCAEYLIEEGYTSSEHLYAYGGSAGGLLMGAIINMKPKLWKGVIAAVPFVDVITTMLDESIPLTTGEYDEWGNPNDKEYYKYMKSYSPYDNVKQLEYPSLLVTTGLHDSQVQYWEPAKWVAKLREYDEGSKMILLHTNMDTGHGGASGRFAAHRETALEYAFLLQHEGILD
jgi:oligopeptidase B